MDPVFTVVDLRRLMALLDNAAARKMHDNVVCFAEWKRKKGAAERPDRAPALYAAPQYSGHDR